jgi:LssY-like putative type I secretion system component LssY
MPRINDVRCTLRHPAGAGCNSKIQVEDEQKAAIALRPTQYKIVRASLLWRRTYYFLAALLLCVCAAAPESAIACEQVPAGQTFRIRLLQPVATYSSTPGTILRAFIIESPLCEGSVALPTGTLVEGHIVSVQKVGMGFRHETANLQLKFDRVIQNGIATDIRAQVISVDNAREKVKDGVIRGNRSTKTLHGYVGNTLNFVMMWHPASFWILPAARATFSILPEPELYYPSGTDLLLQLSAPMRLAAGASLALQSWEFNLSEMSALDEEVPSLPERTSTAKGAQADVVNLAFIGSQGQLANAFQAAGWLSSDAPSTRNGAHMFRALISSNSYPHGPMSEQLMDGRDSDFGWQKGLNCVVRRDHLRVWSDDLTWQGRNVWLGASTRDVGVRFSIWNKELTHRVEPDIDVERERIVRDLGLAGCIESVHVTPRPGMPAHLANATGDHLHTDGALAVVELKDCDAPVFADDSPRTPILARPPSKVTRYFRAQVLSFRDIWRENAAYNAFDLSRMAVRSWRRNHDSVRQASALSLQENFVPGAPFAHQRRRK